VSVATRLPIAVLRERLDKVHNVPRVRAARAENKKAKPQVQLLDRRRANDLLVRPKSRIEYSVGIYPLLQLPCPAWQYRGSARVSGQ
jgi:hypothetical protein